GPHHRHDMRPGGHDALHAPGIREMRRARGPALLIAGAKHAVRGGAVRPLPVRAKLRLRGWARLSLRPDPSVFRGARGLRPGEMPMTTKQAKPRLGVFKFA